MSGPEEFKYHQQDQQPNLSAVQTQMLQVGEFLGTNILPPGEDISTIQSGQFKEQYPERYRIYESTLSESSKPEDEQDPDVLFANQSKLLFLNNLQEYVWEQQHATDEDMTLREHQLPVFIKLVKFFEAGKTSGYIELPTGSGKTVLFIEFIEAAMGKNPGNTEDDLKTLITVPTRQLVRQTERRLEEFAPDIPVGKVYGDEEKVYGQAVTITTYNTLVTDRTIRSQQFDLAFFDEAHRGLSDRRKAIISGFPNMKVGFTASPKYSEQKHVGLLFDEEIHKMTIPEAVDSSLITGFRVIHAHTNVDIGSVRTSSVKGEGEREYSANELSRAVNIAKRTKAGIDFYQEYFPEETALVTCVDIDHANEVAREFQKRGIAAAAVHSEVSQDVQERIQKSAEEGETKVLTIVASLAEGFDLKRATVLLNLAPTMSLVKAIQRGGRVLRIDENNPDKMGYIIEFIDRGSQAISYAQVAGTSYMSGVAADIDPKGRRGKLKQIERLPGKVERERIDIEGLTIVTDAELIMEYAEESVRAQEKAILIAGAKRISTISREFDLPRATLIKAIDEIPEELSEQVIFYNGSIYLQPEASDYIVSISKERTLEKASTSWVSVSRSINSTTGRFLTTIFPDKIGLLRSGRQGPAGYYAEEEVVEYIKQSPKVYPTEKIVGLQTWPEGWVQQDDAMQYIQESLGIPITMDDLVALTEKRPDIANIFRTFISPSEEGTERTQTTIIGIRDDSIEVLQVLLPEIIEERHKAEAATQLRRNEILAKVKYGVNKEVKTRQDIRDMLEGEWVHMSPNFLSKYTNSGKRTRHGYSFASGVAWIKQQTELKDAFEIIDDQLYLKKEYVELFTRNSRKI